MAKEKTRWIGFDLGGTKMLAVAYDEEFNVIGRKRCKSRGTEGAKAGVARILEAILEALAEDGSKPEALAGVGIAVPGPVNSERGVVIEMPNLGWRNLRLSSQLSKALGCPVHLLNDVDAGTYGEYRFGAGVGARCALGVFPGTGIGGGCVYEGNLLRGATRSCMEIGHLQVVPNGARCGCGGRGCVETVASRLAIAQAAAVAAYRGEAPTVLREAGTDLRKIRSGVLAAALKAGDPAIGTLLHDAAHWLGVAIAGAINLLNPDRIILGGGMVEAMPEMFLHDIGEVLHEQVMRAFRRTYRLVVAELGDDAAVRGAAAWALHRERECR